MKTNNPALIDTYEVPVVEAVAQETSTQEVGDTPSPVVEQALNEGWLPQEEFKGDPEVWVDAKEFVFRGELMNRIKKQSGVINNLADETKELKQALNVLGEHNKKLAEVEYKKALATLRKERSKAMSEYDHDTVVEIDDRIDELKEIQRTALPEETQKPANKAPATPVQVQEWLSAPSSQWYHNDVVLRGAANALSDEYLRDNPDDLEGMLRYVDRKIQQEFPHKFDTDVEVSAVSGNNGRSKGKVITQQKGKHKFTPRDLDETQYAVGKTFINQGVYKDMQEWVNQLVETGLLAK